MFATMFGLEYHWKGALGNDNFHLCVIDLYALSFERKKSHFFFLWMNKIVSVLAKQLQMASKVIATRQDKF